MADFSNKKLRKLFEPDGDLDVASAEDLALVMALCKPRLHAALARVEQLSKADNVVLDPEPIKPAKATPKASDGPAD